MADRKNAHIDLLVRTAKYEECQNWHDEVLKIMKDIDMSIGQYQLYIDEVNGLHPKHDDTERANELKVVYEMKVVVFYDMLDRFDDLKRSLEHRINFLKTEKC
jgi:phosphoribosyl 1,2-cyclic phosphodiesterase